MKPQASVGMPMSLAWDPFLPVAVAVVVGSIDL